MLTRSVFIIYRLSVIRANINIRSYDAYERVVCIVRARMIHVYEEAYLTIV